MSGSAPGDERGRAAWLRNPMLTPRRILLASASVLAVGCTRAASLPREAPPAAASALTPAPPYRITTAPALASLERELRARIAQDTAGEVAVALVDLATGHRLGINADVSMHAASTMKVPVLLELFRQADAGRYRVDDSIAVVNTFTSIADGSRYTLATDRYRELVDHLGKPMALRRIAHGMITLSSNLATNILIDHVGAKNVQRTMAAIGAQEMVVLRGVSDNPAFERGLNNMTTAAALARTLEVLARCELHTRRACTEMVAILEEQEFRSEIPAGVPKGVRVANKTGSITGHRHDAAIVMPEGRAPYVLVVLTRGASSTAAATRVAVDVSRRVWQELVPSSSR